MHTAAHSNLIDRPDRRWPGWLLLLCVLAGLAAIVYPAWVIRPFRFQGARELAVAMEMIRVAPAATLAALAAGLIAAFAWRPRGWKRWTAAVGAVVILAAAALVARVDYFELIFRPYPNPRFVPLAQAAIDPDDMVLVARAAGDAHAYPVRYIAYHHLVNDVVGGVPVVATY